MVLTGDMRVMGWREWVELPEFGIPTIKVKVDTGARSSALHASELETVRRRGVEWIRFDVHPIQRETKTTFRAEAPILAWRSVRNSGGKSELRPVIRATIRFLGESWPIELTLTSRDSMGFRMLLGREAIRGRYLVDAGRSFLGGRRKVRKKTGKTSRR